VSGGFVRYREPAREEPTGEFDPEEARRRWLRAGPPASDGRYVLYWLQMYRRAEYNPALAEAIRRANALDLPLLVYEGLNPDYPGACDRIHRLVLECARDTARGLAGRGIPYVFHLRRRATAEDAPAAEAVRAAAVVVTDDFPAFILPGITRAVLARTEESEVPVLAVDGNGVVPLASLEKRQYAARTIRPRLHRLIPACLRSHRPVELEVDLRRDVGSLAPARGVEEVLREGDGATLSELVASCEVDHTVPPSPRFEGGRRAALRRLDRFLEEGLAGYADAASDPGACVCSDLSPYLHFGCLDAREVALRVLDRPGVPDRSVDAFLEQLVVRRELAYNFCWFTPPEGHASLEALPEWARRTIREHRDDEREHLYDAEAFERAATHDELWNAAQRELLATGTIHNYMRMLWGKKILEWSETPEEALRIMLDLHHRYALDGRNPNTYANVLWVFGLHDRAWAERPVLGKLRYMTSDGVRRKYDAEGYLGRVRAWTERAAAEGRAPTGWPEREDHG